MSELENHFLGTFLHSELIVLREKNIASVLDVEPLDLTHLSHKFFPLYQCFIQQGWSRELRTDPHSTQYF